MPCADHNAIIKWKFSDSNKKQFSLKHSFFVRGEYVKHYGMTGMSFYVW